MREIKFRAWVETDDGEEMIHLETHTLDNGLWFNYFEKHINEHLSLMQFTGLKDKNGTECFVGDILKHTLDNGEIRLYKIWVEKGGFVINQFQDDFYRQESEIPFYNGLSDMQTASWFEACLEIIGNIHSNPELLNQ